MIWRLAILLAALTGTVLAQNVPHETLDRGMVARPMKEGKVYLGWRLLATDPADVAFDVYRKAADGEPVKLNQQSVRKTTDFVDSTAVKGTKYAWFVRPLASGKEMERSREATAVAGDEKDRYIGIKFQGDYQCQKVGIADLDGDGQYDFVVKQPLGNVDPYVKYWFRSPSTYKLEAYAHDGRFLWQYDMGWAIEQGIWYSPYVVYDLDGDGRAEVAVKTGEGDPRDAEGKVKSGPEYLTILDGRTGKPAARIDWPARSLFDDQKDEAYNYASRNQLGVAYLDGRTPHLIVERGTYNRIVVAAYRYAKGSLEEVWRWDNKTADRKYWGQGAHWMHAADVDGDGRQEVVLGSFVLDDNGTPLWSTGLGHPDHAYVGDLDPEHPGLEIYYGMETAQKQRNGMCMVDAATGKILWGHEGATRHVHAQGMCSDIDPSHPGCECYSADTDAQKKPAWARLRTAKGEVLSEDLSWDFGPRTAYWDADPQREIFHRGKISKYGGPTLETGIPGEMVAVADILGDWREEIVVSTKGELRIYTTTIPAADRRVCLMQDPLYRMDVVAAAMGYIQVPMTSYDMATSKPR